MLAFKDGILKDIKILNFGGDDLTMQLCEELKISSALAEDIKMSHGSIGDYNKIDNDKEILVKKNNIYKPISQRLLSQILTPKAQLICESIKKSIEEVMPCNKINNFVATGMTVLLEGFLEILEVGLGIPVKLGRIANPKVISWANKEELSGQRYLTYLTSLGIVCQMLCESESRTLSKYQPTSNPILKAVNKFKEIYQEYF